MTGGRSCCHTCVTTTPSPCHLQSPMLFGTGLRYKSGGDLFSRAVSSQVSSALRSLTAVFGMGTGVSFSLFPPEIQNCNMLRITSSCCGLKVLTYNNTFRTFRLAFLVLLASSNFINFKLVINSKLLAAIGFNHHLQSASTIYQLFKMHTT